MGSSLVQDDHFTLLQQHTSQANLLLLSNTDTSAMLQKLVIQLGLKCLDEIFQLHIL